MNCLYPLCILLGLLFCSCTKDDRLVPVEQGTNPPAVFQSLEYEVRFCSDFLNNPSCNSTSPVVNASIALYQSAIDRTNDWQPVVARTGEEGRLVFPSLKDQLYFVRVSTQYGVREIQQSIPSGGKSFRTFIFY